MYSSFVLRVSAVYVVGFVDRPTLVAEYGYSPRRDKRLTELFHWYYRLPSTVTLSLLMLSIAKLSELFTSCSFRLVDAMTGMPLVTPCLLLTLVCEVHLYPLAFVSATLLCVSACLVVVTYQQTSQDNPLVLCYTNKACSNICERLPKRFQGCEHTFDPHFSDKNYEKLKGKDVFIDEYSMVTNK